MTGETNFENMDAKTFAGYVADFHAELVRKGMHPSDAIELAKTVGRAMGSSDGHCGSEARFKDRVTKPM